ncbi:flagellar basal body P-ring formation chaperone FlgA [Rhodoferax sp. UBA5149]|uniref:flagellar basal body P-ring formation chaperone FlgA n=1 Tax=Rhodoferax sp. UBA5149 TaxID=1947379 RepID=UPI0025DB4890|nr:flagellar basal body P-ring formation chaperone FlgA [Rhodoferax sp. UBA5149]
MFNKFPNPIHRLPAAFGLAAAFCFTLGAPTQAAAQVAGVRPEFFDATQRWLDNAVSSVRPSGTAPLRMEVTVGELDSRLRLAPCARVEPYIPVGTSLWGKTRLGLRCLEGAAKWNVFLPVTVKAYGAAWVIKGNVAPGAVLTEADAIETEVDWAEDASPVVSNPSLWVGQVASRALTTGQALRQGMIKPAQVFQAGTQVRVVARGSGFQITADGQALSAGVVGQSARVRMDNGRVMSGVVLDNRTVRLEI